MIRSPVLNGVVLATIIISIAAINDTVAGVVIAIGVAAGVLGFFMERWRLRRFGHGKLNQTSWRGEPKGAPLLAARPTLSTAPSIASVR